MAAGEATITASAGKFQATCSVTVRARIVSVQSVSVDQPTLTILVGQTASLAATVSPDNATNKGVQWSSSAPEVATVTQDGGIQGLKAGTATITVTTVDGAKTASCLLTVDASEMHVVFESNGGTEIPEAVVTKNQTLSRPADPSKTGLSTGLYLGNIDPDTVNPSFEGWYTDKECTTAYDFSKPVTADFTLYAKWSGPAAIDLSSYETEGTTPLHNTFSYFGATTFTEETEFTFVAAENIQLFRGLDVLDNGNVKLHVVGSSDEREIFSATMMNTFSVKGGTIILGKHLKLYNTNIGSFAIVSLTDNSTAGTVGHAVLEDGCKISGSRGATGNGIAVIINSNNCTFTMNGGEISDNQGQGNAMRQATVCVNYGIFTMNGGVISGNSITSALAEGDICGGILHYQWNYDSNGSIHWTKKFGGEIKDNTATRTVTLADGATFYKAQQVLTTGAKKQIDTNIGAEQDLDFSSCYSAPWIGSTPQ